MQEIITACPRDCQDCCSVIAQVKDQKLIKVRGDHNHEVTRGYLCPKGYSYPELIYHPQRIKHPLIKQNGRFKKISWAKVLNLISEQIQKTISHHGPTAIFHYHYSGSELITKAVSKRFFKALGARGVRGDICFQAGIQAQLYDFGGLAQNHIQDLINAQGCILWGRNPLITNNHSVPFIKKALAKGSSLAIINPLATGLEKQAKLIIKPQPGTDALLALACCQYLIEHNLYDHFFVEKFTAGFTEFVEDIKKNNWLQQGIEQGFKFDQIRALSHFLIENKPLTILLGYGIQRYLGGGNTIRAIDALAALSGNIGQSGAGVSYCADTYAPLATHLQHIKGVEQEMLNMSNLAAEIIACDNPKIKMGFITAANPVVNCPDSTLMIQALKSIEQLVVFDMFLTDTAQLADIILPVVSFFEQEGIKASSWSPYLYYCPAVIPPVSDTMSDEDILIKLAHQLKLKAMPFADYEELLNWTLKPLSKWGVSLKLLRENGHYLPPEVLSVAWAEKVFKTPSQKFEFFSRSALQDGQSPVATYVPPANQQSPYPYFLLSPHSKYRIHSQFQKTNYIQRYNPEPYLYLHPQILDRENLKEFELVEVFNQMGSIQAKVRLKSDIRNDTVSIESGWELDSNACVNKLIPGYRSDMGECAALSDVKVGLRKINA